MAYGKKTGGREKGTPNKITAEFRQKINELLTDNFDDIQNEFKNLDPRDKIKLYLAFMNYVLPKYQSIKLEEHLINEDFIKDITPLTFYSTDNNETDK